MAKEKKTKEKTTEVIYSKKMLAALVRGKHTCSLCAAGGGEIPAGFAPKEYKPAGGYTITIHENGNGIDQITISPGVVDCDVHGETQGTSQTIWPTEDSKDSKDSK